MASGRIFKVKKTLLLKTLALGLFFGFWAFVFVAIFCLKAPVLWFYGFCLFFGAYQLAKSALFKFDSSLYLGVLLVCIGISGFLCIYLFPNQMALLVALSFLLASLVAYFFTQQNFHLVIAFSILYVTTFCTIFAKNLISTPILLAFLLPFLLLLILEMIWLCFHKK